VDRDDDLWARQRCQLAINCLRRKHPVVPGKGRSNTAGGQAGFLSGEFCSGREASVSFIIKNPVPSLRSGDTTGYPRRTGHQRAVV
jgi:hypothetical protein